MRTFISPAVFLSLGSSVLLFALLPSPCLWHMIARRLVTDREGGRERERERERGGGGINWGRGGTERERGEGGVEIHM